jgi:lysophospholipase L1-like esterase
MTPVLPRRGLLVLLVGSTLLALILAATAGEVVVRYREKHRSTVPGTMPLLFYRHNRLRHAMVRDYDYFGWIHINRQGFRGRDVERRKRPGVLRIMAVGGSTTFDSFVTTDSAAWPARLQAWLTRLAPDRPVEVINAGVPGYTVVDDLIRLQTELYDYRPDVILLYHAHNDLFSTLLRGSGRPGSWTSTPGEMPVVTPWGHWLTRHSLLYPKLVARFQNLRFTRRGGRVEGSRGAPGRPWADIIAAGASQFQRDIMSFLAVARSMGISVIVAEVVHVSGVNVAAEPDPAIQAWWRRAVPGVEPDTVLEGYRRYNAVLRAAARAYSATFVPTDPFALAGREWYGDDDPIHFNDRGADRMGRAMADALLAVDLPTPPR